MEAVRGQKHPSEAKKGMKELIYEKSILQKPPNNLKKPLAGPIRFELRPQIKKISIKPKPQSAAPKKPGKRDSSTW